MVTVLYFFTSAGILDFVKAGSKDYYIKYLLVSCFCFLNSSVYVPYFEIIREIQYSFFYTGLHFTMGYQLKCWPMKTKQQEALSNKSLEIK